VGRRSPSLLFGRQGAAVPAAPCVVPGQVPAAEKKASRPMGTSPLFLEATAGFEPAIGVLQTPALPLGYVAATGEILS
jgi:hypothetical protein